MQWPVRVYDLNATLRANVAQNKMYVQYGGDQTGKAEVVECVFVIRAKRRMSFRNMISSFTA